MNNADASSNVQPCQNAIARAYYIAFVLALLICLSPQKILAYGAPFIAGSWLFLNDWQVRRKTFLVLLCIVAINLFYFLVNSQYVIIGGLLAAVTYGTLLFLFITPVESLADPRTLERMTSLVSKVLFIEGCFGILQAIVAAWQSGSFDFGNGDAVEGTIRLGFTPDEGFGNPMFAANICFMLLAMVPVLTSKKRSSYLPVILGALAFVLASVMHMIIFMVIAIVLSFLFFSPSIPASFKKVGFVIPLLLVPVVAGILLANNLNTLPGLVTSFRNGDQPKAEILNRALFEMPHAYPAMPLIGLGPGQFSSRAALISTGLYFGGITNPKTLPFLRDQVSTPLASYLMDLWLEASNEAVYGNSSTAKPFFSWISVYTEFGGLVFLGTAIYAAMLLFRMKARAQSNRKRWIAVSAGAGIVFLFLLGFQENYWEVPQALLVGLMLIQVMYANVMYDGEPSRVQ